jgi:tryptophanyl-tRNA synthetase
MPGLDGQKMSKSYGNTITLREDAASVTHKIRRMPTDPARVRRTIPAIRPSARSGNCIRCIRTSLSGLGAGGLPQRRDRLSGVQAAGDRWHPREQAPMRERAQPYLDDPTLVREIIADGNSKARHLARETMRDVREAMGLDYS